MLIQDFKVKEKTKFKTHKETCENCRRVEELYRTVPGMKSNLVYYVAKPCQSILKKARQLRSPEEQKASKELFDFLKTADKLSIATATAEKGKLKEKVFILGKGPVLKA